LISTLLTIVIPCKDSVNELKSTIENIVTQTKINSTRVLVLDLGSKDGSYQYAAQASSEYIRTLKIESIKYDPSKILETINNINSLYVLSVLPGTNFKSNDFILDSLNSILFDENIYIFPFPKKRSIKEILFPRKSLILGKTNISSLLIHKNFFNSIKFDTGTRIDIDKGIINKNIRIVNREINSPFK